MALKTAAYIFDQPGLATDLLVSCRPGYEEEVSRTIERAISAKDDYMLAVKVSQDAQVKLGQLVQAGVFGTRAEAASFLIDEGIKTQTALFERVEQKLGEIERLRAELRGMIGNKPE